ncbi:Biotin carboxyl carrier protein CDS [Bradyrhizobium sp.]|nr:Biotin carboxyl carrier protein CDS [Bradyrhizobium sp.]
MPEIKIVTEVAGRICATPVQVGGTVADGDDVVVVEAMKIRRSRSSRTDCIIRGFRDNLSASSPRSRYGVAIA